MVGRMVRTLLRRMLGRVVAKMLRLKGEEQRALLCSIAPAWKHYQGLEKARDWNGWKSLVAWQVDLLYWVY